MSRSFPTIEEILAMHADLIAQFRRIAGAARHGSAGVRGHAPADGYYDSLFQEVAALMESLAMNHPFVDGNKRVA